MAVLAPRLLFFLLPMAEKHAAPTQDASLDGATIRGTFGEYNRFYFSRDAPQGRFLGLAFFPLRKCTLRSKMSTTFSASLYQSLTRLLTTRPPAVCSRERGAALQWCTKMTRITSSPGEDDSDDQHHLQRTRPEKTGFGGVQEGCGPYGRTDQRHC